MLEIGRLNDRLRFFLHKTDFYELFSLSEIGNRRF